MLDFSRATGVGDKIWTPKYTCGHTKYNLYMGSNLRV
jgi:hypothetical protein